MESTSLTSLAELAVAEYMRSGEAAAKIAKVAQETCDRAIESCLSGYDSPFRKQMTAAVTKCLGIHGDIDLPSYNDAILKIIAKQVEHGMHHAIEKQVAERMKSLLTPAPESIKLSELVEQYREHLNDRVSSGCVCYGDNRFAISIEQSDAVSGYVDVSLDEGSEKKGKYQQDIRLSINKEGVVYALSFQNADVEKRMFAGPFYGFERSLFQMKASGTKIIVDVNEHDVDTSYGEGHD